jgi:hypothetical protein
MPSGAGMDDARLGSLGRTSHQEVMPTPAAAGQGTFPGPVPPLAAERGAEGQGAEPPAPAPVAAGQGAAPEFGPQEALDAIRYLPQHGTFAQLRDILARVQPPIEWLQDPTSPQYRQVFIGLDPQVQPAIPGLPVNVPFWHNKMTAEFYLAMRIPRGGRKKLSRKRNARSRRTRRDSERGRTRRSRRTGGRT